jgi:hypothetical protein
LSTTSVIDKFDCGEISLTVDCGEISLTVDCGEISLTEDLVKILSLRKVPIKVLKLKKIGVNIIEVMTKRDIPLFLITKIKIEEHINIK